MLQTKLCAPIITNKIVIRKKIEGKLIALQDYKVVLVSAPAGYGKTTAVASFLAQEKLKYAWFSIDDADNDPVRFWRYIITAIAGCLNNDRLNEIEINMELVSSNITTDLFINIVSQIPESIVLVLDDYHLIYNEAVLKSVGYLVKYMPRNIRVVILSRKEPDGELSLLSLREMAVFLGIMDFLFNPEETAELFLQRGIRLSEDQINLLCKYTEGWVAGLIAASYSIKETENSGSDTIAMLKLSHIEKNEETGIITVVLELSMLPEGTTAIRLENGDVFPIDAENRAVQFEISEKDVHEDGTIKIIAINMEEIPLGSYILQVTNVDEAVSGALNDAGGSVSILLKMIGILVAAAIGAVVIAVILRKMKKKIL